MRWCRTCGLTLLFLLLTSHSIHAYERDVHYDLTKYLARWAGFSEDEAEQVATADQEIDAKPEFNPLPNPNFCPELRKIAGPASAIVAVPVACKNDPEFQRMVTAQRAYHFVDSERLQALRESAFQGRNLKTLGHYLHALQDIFAHSLMDYADLPPLDKLVANLGRLPDAKIIGHLLYGHSLDKTYERPDLAEQMARYVYAELVRFKGSVNRWNELEATVARFVREKDPQKQLKYIAALPLPESAQAPSKSEGSTEPVGLAVKQSTDRPAASHSEPSKTSPQELTAQSTLPTGYPKGIDEETQLEFAFGDNKCLERPYQWPPAMLSGSVLVIAKLPNTFTDLSRLDEELVKRILDKGRDFALAQCPRIESARHRTVIGIDVLLFESSAKTHDRENALVRGSYSSEVKDFQSLFFYADSRLKELQSNRGAEEVRLRKEAAQRQAQQQREPCYELDNSIGSLYASTSGLRPCVKPKEGDEARKVAAERLADAFRNRHGVREMVGCEPLSRNPFAFEGATVGVQVTFDKMADRGTGIFRGRAGPQDRGMFGPGASLVAGCPIVVSGIPQGTFGTTHQEVVLAAKVLGRSGQSPHLQFVGIYICKQGDCADFFGPESLR